MKQIQKNHRKKSQEFEGKEVFISPLIKSMKGAFKMPVDFNYKKELETELSKKYGLSAKGFFSHKETKGTKVHKER
jgi:hypothetical protein